tara:strand:+ start:309 stop:908 length:600 start_codon:yes stop_codon:yes gene_type:complete
MSNFTKSIFYSTAVLAIGLIAIFAIYDMVAKPTGTLNNIAGIEPAAGGNKSDLGIDAETMSQSLDDIKETAGNTITEVKEEVVEMKNALEKIQNEPIIKNNKPLDYSEAGEVVEFSDESSIISTEGEEIPSLDTPVEKMSDETAEIQDSTPAVEDTEPAAGAEETTIIENATEAIENVTDTAEEAIGNIDTKAPVKTEN